MLWERINAKPLVTIFLYKLFDKTCNFAALICWTTTITRKAVFLKKSDKVCMEVNRLRYLSIEIYKSINSMKQTF